MLTRFKHHNRPFNTPTATLATAALLLAAVAALVTPRPAHAWATLQGWFAKMGWPGSTCTFEIAGISPSSPVYDAVFDAADAWNDSAVNFSFNVLVGDGTISSGNGENEVATTSSAAILGDAPAICYTWYDPFMAQINEADIYVDSDTTWTDSTDTDDLNSYGGDARSAITTLIHEMGHALGLLHENGVYNVMGQDWNVLQTNAGVARPYIDADSTAGGTYLYGWDTSLIDVGVAHWKWCGADGEYSEHCRTGVYDLAQRPRPVDTTSGEPVYTVMPGTMVVVEFTYETLGLVGGMVPVDFYLSTNDNITTWDDLIGSTSVVAIPAYGETVKTTLTIPSWVTPGDYWIGPIVDVPGDDVGANDSTYVGIHVDNHYSDRWSLCSPGSPCDRFMGDCDTDADCSGSLKCIHNQGAAYVGTPSSFDVCDYEAGDWSYCSPESPCFSGMGDCDSDAECQWPFHCAHNVGAQYGFASNLDLCM